MLSGFTCESLVYVHDSSLRVVNAIAAATPQERSGARYSRSISTCESELIVMLCIVEIRFGEAWMRGMPADGRALLMLAAG